MMKLAWVCQGTLIERGEGKLLMSLPVGNETDGESGAKGQGNKQVQCIQIDCRQGTGSPRVASAPLPSSCTSSGHKLHLNVI